MRLNKEARAEIMGSPPRLSASFNMPSRPGALLFSSFVNDSRTSSFVMSISQNSDFRKWHCIDLVFNASHMVGIKPAVEPIMVAKAGVKFVEYLFYVVWV
jgi:hypothetical protein